MGLSGHLLVCAWALGLRLRDRHRLRHNATEYRVTQAMFFIFITLTKVRF